MTGDRSKLKHGLTNLKGTTVGFLTVVKRVYRAKGKKPAWSCTCTCGNTLVVNHNRLIDKVNPKSHCGCRNPRKTIAAENKKEYHAWWDAKNRCHNPDHPSYPSYGAKGIRMYPAWQESFGDFLDYVGPAPRGKSLDRIDPFGHYEPGNVRWASDKTQARNKKGTKLIEHPKTGQRIPVAELAEELGLTYHQLRNQLIEEGKWK